MCDMNCNVQIDGELLSCPVTASIGRWNGEMVLYGKINRDSRRIDEEDGTQARTELAEALDAIAKFFGVRELVCLYQSGNGMVIWQIIKRQCGFSDIPVAMRGCNLLTYANISFEGEGLVKSSVRDLFGIRETVIFLGMGSGELVCMISLGKVRTDFIESTGIYMLMQFGARTGFLIRGTFRFVGLEKLKGMTFTVDCGVNDMSFQIEAFAHVERPIALFGPFSIGDTCLMIKAGQWLQFGLYSSLYIRNIQLFGAVILQVEGEVVEPKLLSASVSDLSIPILLDNLLGEHIAGIECMSFIKIMGLPFRVMQPFGREQLERKDIHSIVEQFNAGVNNDASLVLDKTQVQLTPYGAGMDLADLRRMRHYYIDNDGRLRLSAQFYYSTISTTFGNYTVDPGIFMCGVVEIFGHRFEALFSMREADGILAYAKIPEMDLGFIRIGPSSYGGENRDIIPIAENSVLTQFINPKQSGFIFFLSACRNNISFYLDGSVEILRMFKVDSRIVFTQGMILIDLNTSWLSMFNVTLHIKVGYSDFTSGRFEFALMIDTTGLTDKLNAVKKRINAAVERLRNKINNAKAEIDRAQNQVNQLYGQIRYFDDRIEDCRKAIHNASWWKRPFVAVAKGIEIGAYEVAKAGIYVSIGVATAALNVAKGVLNLSEVVGKNVLKAVNAVIDGAMALFYINYIKLTAMADAGQQYFGAEIDLIVLGKHYNYSTHIGRNVLTANPAEALSGVINEKIGPDLDNIEHGTFKGVMMVSVSNENDSLQHYKELDKMKEHLNASVELMKSMQETYVDEMCVPMEEFDELNMSLTDALQHVENTLSAGAQMGDLKALDNAMDGLKNSMAAQDGSDILMGEDQGKTSRLIEEYDNGCMLYDKLLDSIENVKKRRQDILLHNEELHGRTEGRGELVMNVKEEDMAAAIHKIESQMYDTFSEAEDSGFINLSREELIHDLFSETKERVGVVDDVMLNRVESDFKNNSKNDDYRMRLW